MPVKLNSLSKEYLLVEVEVEVDGAAHDPTGDVVEFSFVVFATDDDPSVWASGEWETDPGLPAKYFARILIGPGAVVVTDGKYHVWIRVTDSPEIPVRRVGVLTIE